MPILSRPFCLLACTAVALCSLLASLPARAQDEISEASVKAAYIFKFLGYVEWPPTAFPSPDAPFVIGVAGEADVAAELATIVPGRTVNNHPVTLRAVKPGDSLDGLHLLVVGSSVERMAQRIAEAQQRSIVTVTQSPDALAVGSVINFLVTAGKVRFEISLDSAEKSGVKLSSRLLPVASHVVQRRP